MRPRKAHSLVKKNFLKGGWLHSTATVHVRIAGQHKKTAQVDGSHPTFSDVIEFILGRLQNKTLNLMNISIGPLVVSSWLAAGKQDQALIAQLATLPCHFM